MKIKDEILLWFPEWEKYSTRKLISSFGDEECIWIEIPSPADENQNLIIEAFDKAVVIYFGPTHLHIDCVPNQEVFDAIKEITTKIFNEQWVAFRAKTFFFYKYYGIGAVDQYNKKKRENKILESYSWKGTYNYIKNK